MRYHVLFALFFSPFLAVMLIDGGAAADQPDKPTATPVQRPANPAFARVTDDPKLPRVLLIGDSISIGYTVPTQKLLAGQANVHRAPTNCGPTTRGLEQIDEWLGKEKWDVIHFNWGLHDLKFVDGKRQVPIDQYEKNLKTLVARLKKTDAKLIWCSTTPVPSGVSPSRTNKDVLAYNRLAQKIMRQNGIKTNNLYTFADARLKDIQRPQNVHFTLEGSQVLCTEVVRHILAAIGPKDDK